MSGPAAQHEVDHEALADLLKALAYPVRLELLETLRERRALREIELRPHRVKPGENPDRPIARQTVQAHLDKLVEAGLVRVDQVEDGGREYPVYVANPSRMYAVMEEMRSIIVQYAGRGLDPDMTSTIDRERPPERLRGPRLVLVRGVYEGQAYPLTPEASDDGGWTIGRARRLTVSLDYDPFVSHESAVVTQDRDGFAITDLGSKNGTWLNWGKLETGSTARLEAGDVIGVGRSLLVFLGAPG